LETTLTNKVVYSKQVTLSAARPLSASICWTDPVGFGAVATITADNRTPKLVNNLDLKIIDNTGRYIILGN
jgi:hypothetical protein